MTCGGTCKVGFMNQIIWASKLIQEYKGLAKAAHINDQLMEMVVLRETGRACGMASATKGAAEPAGPVMANKIMLQRVIDYEHDKNIVRQTLNITRLRFTAFLIIAPSAADNPS